MDFRVNSTSASSQGLKRCCVLTPNTWDDWFEFETVFYLEVYDESGQGYKAGLVKIGERGLKGRRRLADGRQEGYRYPSVPPFSSPELPPNLFSLGQDETYYETVNQLPETLRVEILLATSFRRIVVVRMGRSTSTRLTTQRIAGFQKIASNTARAAEGVIMSYETRSTFISGRVKQARSPQVLRWIVMSTPIGFDIFFHSFDSVIAAHNVA